MSATEAGARVLNVGSRVRTCLNVVSHPSPEFGGISATIAPLSNAMAATSRYEVPVAAFLGPGEDLATAESDCRMLQFPMGRIRWMTGTGLRRAFSELVAGTDLLHIHGLWEEHCMLAASFARKHGKPYLISAHGMLAPWALRNKRWKKALYSLLVEGRNLRGAQCLRALTQAEAADYRRCGLTGPVAVIPNGVEAPRDRKAERFLERYPELRGKELVLFLGRIHYKKGPDLLCRAAARICRQHPEVHVVFAGPDFENTQRELTRLIGELGVGDRVTLTGMLRGEAKWDALAAARVFVLPSHSEGFSVAILEALACGAPVIVTRQCNFPEVAAMECGWQIEPEVHSLETALEECLAMPAAGLRWLGENGQRLIRDRYAWSVIGRQMAEVYDWLLGGPRPSSVEVGTS